MFSKERSKQIADFAKDHGNEKAALHMGISVESVKRAIRNIAPTPAKAEPKIEQDKLFEKLKAKFSREDLESLLKANTSNRPRPNPSIDFDGDEVSILVLSDTHVGSTYFDDEKLLAAFKEAESQGCQMLMHSGDVLEGMSGRPGQIYELTEIGHSAQVAKAVKLFSEWKKPIFFCTGNHDNWVNTKAGIGLAVGEELERLIPNSKWVGHNEGEVTINGARFMLWHGEDSSAYSHSYRAQKIIEAFTGGEKPNVLITGHVHKAFYMFDRNVHTISAGCIQRQSGFMRYKRLAAHCGFWIVKCTIDNGEIKKFSPTFYPFYK